MFRKSHSRSSSTSRPESDNSGYDTPIGRMQPAKQALQSAQQGGKSRSRTSSEGNSHNSSGYRPYQSASLSRTVNPMNYPLDNLTALSIALSGNSPYSAENITLPTRQNIHHAKSSSTNSSPSNHGGRTNSLQNVSARERSLERLEREYMMMGERSLDRHALDRMQLLAREGSTTSLIDTRRGYNTTGGGSHIRDRSLDREYPHMGARSLERDHHLTTSRSRSSDRSDYDPMSSSLMSGSLSPQEYRNSFMFDLQVQITELHKECAKLQKELDNTNAKLCSSMNSIKTFWSPELKKERTIRKDETARYVLLNEQYRVAQAELQKKNDLLKQYEKGMNGEVHLPPLHISSQDESDPAVQGKDEAKEILILRKTVDEMELRIETQKQTLSARDESIKKLLEMLQSKGLSVKQFDEDRHEVESLRSKLIEEEKRVKNFEILLEQKDAELTKLIENVGSQGDSGLSISSTDNTHTMQAIIEAKDSRVGALEQEVQTLEDRLLKLQEESSYNAIDRRDGTLTKDNQSAKEKDLRSELEKLRGKLSEKENEVEGLRLKVETAQRQQAEKEQYVCVLKEQISAKELHSTMLQADIEDLNDRVKDKEGTIERKSKQSQSINKDKRRMENEMLELKDLIDVKERKISVLNRKITDLEETNKQKDEQLDQAKSRNLAIFTNSSNVSGLEESIQEKDRLIERLKEQRDRAHQDNNEELEQYTAQSQDLKSQLEKLHQELNSKQTELCELREEVTELKSDKFKLESKIRVLEAELIDKKEEIDRLHDRQTEESNQEVHSKEQTETSEKDLMQLQGSIEQSQSEALKAQKEVEKLTEELTKIKNEGEEKDSKIKEFSEIIKEYKQKMGTLKRSQQSEKKKNAQLLEEAWKREVNLNEDSSQLLSQVDQNANRIEELEEALRESVKITAEREMDMVEQQQQLEESKIKISELKTEIETLQLDSTDYNGKLSSLNKLVEEKDLKLRKLQAERFRHLDEVFEMKQEAIQAAISEKDTNIALLEMTSTKAKRNTDEIFKLNKEKENLQEQLKDVTQNRIKLASKDDKGKERKKLIPQTLRTPDKLEPSPTLSASDTTSPQTTQS